jgi:hypothetical protein
MNCGPLIHHDVLPLPTCDRLPFHVLTVAGPDFLFNIFDSNDAMSCPLDTMDEENIQYGSAQENMHSPIYSPNSGTCEKDFIRDNNNYEDDVKYNDRYNDENEQESSFIEDAEKQQQEEQSLEYQQEGEEESYDYGDIEKESSAVRRHLTYDDDKENIHQYEEEQEEDEEYDNYRRRQRDIENPPDEEMSRKFDTVPSQSLKRTNSSDSLEDIGSMATRKKGGGRQVRSSAGSDDGWDAGPIGRLLLAMSPAKAWLGAVWRDLTCANLSHCGVEAKAACVSLFRAQDTWSMCLQYLLVGLALSFVCEVLHQGPQYNTSLLLALIASFEFHFFPTNSVRPQLVMSVLVVASLVLDIMLFAQPPRLVSHAAKALTSIVFLTKGLALYNFLCVSNTGSRAKKYLWRRIRVFFPPLSYPRKPMREIRSRVLAIEWLQGGVAVGYLVLFFFGYSTIGVANVMSSPSAGMPLVAFLPIKFLTSSAILMVSAINIFLFCFDVLCVDFLL